MGDIRNATHSNNTHTHTHIRQVFIFISSSSSSSSFPSNKPKRKRKQKIFIFMIRHFAMRAQLVLKVWLAGRFAVVCVFGKKAICTRILEKKKVKIKDWEEEEDGGYSSWVLFL
jgi:hypothetical protein